MSYRNRNTTNVQKGDSTIRNELTKVYAGKVKDNRDIERMGRLKVWIPEISQLENDENGWITVSYASPFGGATNLNNNSNENDFAGTQKSYGMWFTPPDINNIVLIVFVNGQSSNGYWFSCVYQDQMNHMIPGLAMDHDQKNTVPKAEFNKKTNVGSAQYPRRPQYDPLVNGLMKQGLLADHARGPSSSSARREGDFGNSVDPQEKLKNAYRPSRANGILTPGGHQFVMDDGNNDGASKFIRHRTASGAQILISETDGMVYVINRDGTAWIELAQDGNIDMWSAKSVNIRSNEHVNIRADKDINIEAGENLNIRTVNDSINIESAKNMNTTVEKDLKITVKKSADLKITDSLRTSAKNIDQMSSNSTKLGAGAGFNISSVDDTVIWTGGSNLLLNTAEAAQPKEASEAKNIERRTKQDISLQGEPAEQVETILTRFTTHEPCPEHAPTKPILKKKDED